MAHSSCHVNFNKYLKLNLLKYQNIVIIITPLLSKSEHSLSQFHQENTRYVYMPIDEIYLLLITNKTSNIIEDLEVLRILNRVISEICIQINEKRIKQNQFEILLAIDDVISSGLRESTSIAQVQSALDMESSEEMLHIMLRKAQENEAKEIAKQHQIEIERKRQEELAKKSKQGAIDKQKNKVPAKQDAFSQPVQQDMPVASDFSSTQQVIPEKTKTVKTAAKKGMQLGKKKQDIPNIFDQE